MKRYLKIAIALPFIVLWDMWFYLITTLHNLSAKFDKFGAEKLEEFIND